MKNAIMLAVAALVAAALPMRAQSPYSNLYQDLPIALEQPQLPGIPDAGVTLTDFGAKGDGVTDCTKAFAEAIKSLPDGGHVIVPQGVWLTGPIVLQSGIDLHLESGALVIFNPDKSLYLKAGEKRVVPCISATGCHDISITGKGVLDGNGKYWRYAKREKLSETEWKDLLKLGGTVKDDKLWFPYDLNSQRNITTSPEDEEAIRQHMIYLKRCKRVLLEGVTVQNSPKFHIMPSQCEDVVLSGLTVRCPWNAQNGDGIDIGNSRRVLVTGCTMDVGDDGICMKGGSGASGVKAGMCSDILVTGCTVFHAHGGFVVGSDVSGGMERIVVTDCVFSGTDTGLRFKSALDRGGLVHDIHIRRIMMNDIREAAITFSCDYANVTYKASQKAEDVEYAPEFREIAISQLTCRECVTAVQAKGIKGLHCVHGITIDSSTFFHTGMALDVDPKTTEVLIGEDVAFRTF